MVLILPHPSIARECLLCRNPRRRFRLPKCTSLIVTFLTVQVFTRHRQAEITDAHWLEEYEKRHNLKPGGHGAYWRKVREQTSADARWFTPLARLRGYQTWAIGLSMFGVAAMVVLVISIGWPQLLQTTTCPGIYTG